MVTTYSAIKTHKIWTEVWITPNRKSHHQIGQLGHDLISSYLVLHWLLNWSLRIVQPSCSCTGWWLAASLVTWELCPWCGRINAAWQLLSQLPNGLSRVGVKKPHWPSEESRFTIDKPLVTGNKVTGCNKHFSIHYYLWNVHPTQGSSLLMPAPCPVLKCWDNWKRLHWDLDARLFLKSLPLLMLFPI